MGRRVLYRLSKEKRRRGKKRPPIVGAALKNEPPLLGRMKMYLLYDGFFSFAVVRQISIDTFLKVPLLLLVTLFLLQLLYRYIL